MNLLAHLLTLHVPTVVRSRILDELFAATAAGFGQPAPETAGMSHDARLAAYARFTRDGAARAIAEGDHAVETQARLRREAVALGERMRGVLGVTGTAEALAVARPLYSAIGVDFRGDAAGVVTVRRCFFSDVYTPDVCRLRLRARRGIAGRACRRRPPRVQPASDGGRRLLPRAVRGRGGRGGPRVSRPTAIVVGTGAGGATVARELQGDFDVTVLEAGGSFQPFEGKIRSLERVRATGLLLDERETSLLFPPMRIRKTVDQVLVSGRGLGGTTTIATGNALRMDAGLRAIGIDLGPEFAALEREIPISTAHRGGWREVTRRLFAICEEMGLDPFATPKMGDFARCGHCGRCVFGCPRGVKWDSREFLDDALERGATLETECRVERVEITDGRATGILARQGWRRRRYAADLVVLAAGGLGTPVILERSGIPTEHTLFVDPVLCVAARLPGCRQCFELQMPFVVQRDGFIVSPYFDYLSFFYNEAWRYPAEDLVGLMIKVADEETGQRRGRDGREGADGARPGAARGRRRAVQADPRRPGRRARGHVPRNGQCRPPWRDAPAHGARGGDAPSRPAAAQPVRRGCHASAALAGQPADADDHGPREARGGEVQGRVGTVAA